MTYPGTPNSQLRVVTVGMYESCVTSLGKDPSVMDSSRTSWGAQVHFWGILAYPTLLVFRQASSEMSVFVRKSSSQPTWALSMGKWSTLVATRVERLVEGFVKSGWHFLLAWPASMASGGTGSFGLGLEAATIHLRWALCACMVSYNQLVRNSKLSQCTPTLRGGCPTIEEQWGPMKLLQFCRNKSWVVIEPHFGKQIPKVNKGTK